jgi:large subunit ribosomal protein L29
MKIFEMRSMEPAVLSTEVEKLRRELLELRCKVALGEDVRPHRLKEIRKEIARILTVLGEKAAFEEGVKA